ncbi:unnamed protein product, partial [Allacma fusca]
NIDIESETIACCNWALTRASFIY